MRKSLFLMLAVLAGPALADGGVTVRLPEAAQLSAAASPDLLHQLVLANVIGSNCPAFAISDGEWALLTGSADMVAEVLELDTARYDAEFYGPAFATLDQPGACEAHGPGVRTVIDQLKAMGGSTDPIG